MIKYRPKYYLVPLLFLLLMTLSFWSQAQITVETQELETPITGKAVLYATVLITDTDETGSIDGLIGLSQSIVSVYSDFSCIVRWNGSVGGTADVHVNGNYDKTGAIPIAFNTKYSIWFDIDMEAKSYQAYIKTPDMDNPKAMSSKGTFRKTDISSITRWTATKQNPSDDGPHVGTVAIVNSVGEMPAGRSESTLTALSVTTGSLSPAFSPDVFNYDLSIPAGVSSVTITPSVKDHGTKVTGGGTINVSAGAGTETIVLVSDDESSTNTYTINYTVLDENSDATLSGITTDKGLFAPKFNKETLNYFLDLPLGQNTVNISATATKAGQGQSAVAIDNNGIIDVSSGTKKVNITVTAPNGISTITYTVTVRPINLKHAYTFEDGTANDMVGSANGTIHGDVEFVGGGLVTDSNGEYVSFNSSELNLNSYGSISVETVITAGDGVNDKFHMLWYFGGEGGASSFWAQINTDGGGEPYSRMSITPGGTANANYGSEVDDGQLHHIVAVVNTDSLFFYLDGVKVATAKTNAASITGLSKMYAFLGESGYASDPTWMGTYHEFNIYQGTMLKEDVAARSYAFLSDASLKSLSLSSGVLSPAFNKETLAYSATVPSNLSTVTVTALSTAPSATVTGAGEVSVGSQTNILVTSSTGNESKTYTINWTKLGANADATLATLVPSTGSLMPAFNSMVKDYQMVLPYGVEVVNFTSSASNSGATVVANPSVDVSTGEATYEVTVISSDASVTNKYTVHIMVDAFKLTALSIGGIEYAGEIVTGTLSPAFSDAVSEYTVTFPSNIVKGYVGAVTSNDPNIFVDYPDTIDFRYVDEAVLELDITSENLKYKRSISIKVAVSENVYHTMSGSFDPALAAKNHIVYARITVPENGVAIDGLFSFSNGYAREWPQTSGGIRFEDSQGLVQINNNGNYEPASGTAGGVPILYDTIYHAWIKISPADTLYSVYARLDGASEPTIIGEDAGFRFDTNMIDTWAALSATGSNQGLHVERVALVNSVGTIPAKGTDATLATLAVDYGTLSPAFDPAVLDYTVVVPSTVEAVSVSAMTTDRWAMMSGAGEVVFDNGVGMATIMVVAEDGETTKTYTIALTQSTEATDATLSALTADKGTLSPVFSAGVTAYTLNVPALTTSVTLTATTTVAGATVSGAGLIDLSAGAKKVDVVVTAQDGTTQMTYSVDIKIAAASTVATLESLRVDVGTLAPVFSSAVTSYAVTVPFGTQSVKVTYKPTDATATATVTSNGVVPVTHLSVTTAEVVVTAQDGVTKKTYTIAITVTPPSTDSSLKALSVTAGSATLNPAFSASVFNYTVDVPFGTSSVEVMAESNFAGQTKISGIGTIDVSSGSATVNVVVTAEDGTTSTYVIVMTVLDPATDADLSSITVVNGTLEPVFSPDVLEYISVVPLGTFTANVKVTTSDSRATYSGAGAIDVVTGSGVANIVVTAEDVTVKKTYKVTVYVGSKPKVILSAEEQLTRMLNIYPNPAADLLTLDLSATEMNEVQVTIFNVDGKLLKSQMINKSNNTIDISTLRNGLLMVQLKYGDTTVVRKVLKK